MQFVTDNVAHMVCIGKHIFSRFGKYDLAIYPLVFAQRLQILDDYTRTAEAVIYVNLREPHIYRYCCSSCISSQKNA